LLYRTINFAMSSLPWFSFVGYPAELTLLLGSARLKD
jgi:hypothetical protein